QETPEREMPPGVILPGLQSLARLGMRTRLAGGWRPWLAEWVSERYPNTLAAAAAGGLPAGDGFPAATVAAMAVNLSSLLTANGNRPTTAWIGTPVHLLTGLTSLHLDRRGMLRLPEDEAWALAEDFGRVFYDSGYVLRPLRSGDFLLLAPFASG